MKISISTARGVRLLAVALCTTALLGLPASAQQPPGPPAAIQELRRHMLDGDVNTLTFRSMGEFFDTRPVPRSGPVQTLPVDIKPLDATYSFDGKEYPVEEGLVRTFTNAVLVIKDGRIVYEKYLNMTGPETRFISWSMAKSITSLLVGAALRDGHIKSLDTDVTAFLPELKGSGYEGVTIRQALMMRSGVDWDERYDFGKNPSPAARIFEDALVASKVRYADAARGLARRHAPGSIFNYSTVETAVLGWLVERAAGRPVADYMAETLWGPLGAEADGFWIADGPKGAGREFTGAGFNARLRDFGRLGLMVLNDGAVGGRQILPAAWIKESTRPYDGPGQQPEGPLNYGYQWWTVKGTTAFTALGLQGQYTYIDPATRTVVVKLSHFPPGASLAAETGALLAAISKWQPK